MASHQQRTRPERNTARRDALGRPSIRSGSVSRASTRQVAHTSTARYNDPAAIASRMEQSAVSPEPSAASTVMSVSNKRKARDFESDTAGEENFINVVVRCRGRNEREVRENSNVVVSTEGVKGKLVNLRTGPTALNDKTYNFDRVFSPAADQNMVFDDVVKPILDEMLAGYNCTIFAYGQTGTGKTYTMSGDMTSTLGILSDEAGIIPRVLQGLFNKLEMNSMENCVKVSFVELYNEELCDLISAEETTKLKIYDDTSRKGHASTIVQGMEEKHIENAAEGIKVLQEGSLRRQVAATKCNDLSSRSHTVFTITAYVRRTVENGPNEFVQAGKLNLVDLAGSENIQRSGAENKRAAEAGLINKSLLTLGRVINALVDNNAHIPYRESKLTRLLQDSLGGRTKTCIIATVSPARSNLEETISTLDYAFRAKNIQNKPQLNPPVDKKILLRDFTNEIERLKGELTCHRQRSGVYLSNDVYDDINTVSESRRIVLEEQSAKIEILETNLRNKVQEFFNLKTSFMGLKKDHEGTRTQLEQTKEVLDQTELIVATTRKSLAEEMHVRMAHEKNEEELKKVGTALISTLHQTIGDVESLHAKNKRRSDLQALNQTSWNATQGQVSDVTTKVRQRAMGLYDEQSQYISNMSSRMRTFVDEELSKLSSTQIFLTQQLDRFKEARRDLLGVGKISKDNMDEVLEEIESAHNAVKERYEQSLRAISTALERTVADVLGETNAFHRQLDVSYSALNNEFKSAFEKLIHELTTLRSESNRLRYQLQDATRAMVEQNKTVSQQVQDAIENEKRNAAQDRQRLMNQIASLISAQGEAQELRLADNATLLKKRVLDANTTLEDNLARYGDAMDIVDKKEAQLLDEVKKSRDALHNKLKDDWDAANNHNASMQTTAKSVHDETERIIDEQVIELDVQIQAFDHLVTRARSENGHCHKSGTEAIQSLSDTIELSYGSISQHFENTFKRVSNLGGEMDADTCNAERHINTVKDKLCGPLDELREEVVNSIFREYEPTGDTPRRVQYQVPNDLPKTESYDVIVARMRDNPSPSKPTGSFTVFSNTLEDAEPIRSPPKLSAPLSVQDSTSLLNMNLREPNPNLTTTLALDPAAKTMPLPAENLTIPTLKIRKTRGRNGEAEGKENIVPDLLMSTGRRRKSARLQ